MCSANKFLNKPHTLHYWLDVLDGGTMWDVGGNPDDHDVIITSIGEQQPAKAQGLLVS